MGQSIDQRMSESWDDYLASPAEFAGADDIITNLAKEREPGIETTLNTRYILDSSTVDWLNRGSSAQAVIKNQQATRASLDKR